MFRFSSNSLFLLLLIKILSAQNLRVPVEALGERLLAVVPLIGTGTPTDPWRPKHTPLALNPAVLQALARDGKAAPLPSDKHEDRIAAEKTTIRSYAFLPSSDGKRAIVEYVARDRAAFAGIIADREVEILDRKKLEDPAELERIRKIRPGFEPNTFRAAGY